MTPAQLDALCLELWIEITGNCPRQYSIKVTPEEEAARDRDIADWNHGLATAQQIAPLLEARVREDEREACAKVCDILSDMYAKTEGRKLPELRTDAERGVADAAHLIRDRSSYEDGNETVWLIESRFTGVQSTWWSGGDFGDTRSSFSTDPNAAVRFYRKQDAEAAAKDAHMVKVTEHVFIRARKA